MTMREDVGMDDVRPADLARELEELRAQSLEAGGPRRRRGVAAALGEVAAASLTLAWRKARRR